MGGLTCVLQVWVSGGVLSSEVLQDERQLVLAARFLASSITEGSLRLQLCCGVCAVSAVLSKIELCLILDDTIFVDLFHYNWFWVERDSATKSPRSLQGVAMAS